ncbi:MAG TPA: Gfo/Idh/MocA family oxidoreductase [bacterium]|nr:Gfo/Idh/MocA family oxidoreductase [bacterium]HNS49165.1 Gfo/Idh/MocA family oxidoreductase [bacterium]
MAQRKTGLPTRVLVMGLGRGNAFVNAALNSRELELAGIIDLDAERLKRVAADWQLRPEQLFTSLAQARSAGPADLLVIATPTHLHADHVVAGFQAGMHVLCEKPLVTTRLQAHRLSTAARRYRRRLAVVQNMRFNPLARRCRELLAEGAIGRLNSLEINFHRWRPALKLGHPHAVLFNHGVHHIDLARSIGGGRPLSVEASEWDPPWWKQSRKGHCLRLTARMSGGWTLCYNASYAEAGRETPHSGEIRLAGSAGSLEMGGEIDRDPQLWLHQVKRAVGQETRRRIAVETGDWRGMDRELLEGFSRAIRKGAPWETDLSDNLKSLEILFRAAEYLEGKRAPAARTRRAGKR